MGDVVRRRRVCKRCGVSVYTEEVIISVGKTPHQVNKKPKPEPVRSKKKRVLKPRRSRNNNISDLDIDSMSDEELEAWITRGQ